MKFVPTYSEVIEQTGKLLGEDAFRQIQSMMNHFKVDSEKRKEIMSEVKERTDITGLGYAAIAINVIYTDVDVKDIKQDLHDEAQKHYKVMLDLYLANCDN